MAWHQKMVAEEMNSFPLVQKWVRLNNSTVIQEKLQTKPKDEG
jgi:hypothetical protein